MKRKEPIVLVGGGGHCKSCIDVIESTESYEILGILDVAERVGATINGYLVIGTDDDIKEVIKRCSNFAITVGQIKSSNLRRRIFEKILNHGGILPTIISPLAYVSQNATIGMGTIVMHHALVNANAHIGQCAIINTKALIEHEVLIGDFCHISTGALINGQTNVGNCVFVGSNAVLANNITVADDAIIAAGSRILKDIPISRTYFGNK
jgi:sugar O-acyltransferase (sialic acid O-acetyltransferase NeuD family)